MPFLNVVANRDDLRNSGHVGLMIRKTAHKELRPKVGEWLKSDHNKEYLT